jgi:hypothetical protein
MAVRLIYAVDTSASPYVGKTGDQANITVKVSKDGAAPETVIAGSGHPTQVNATDAPGLYAITLSSDEEDVSSVLAITAKSTTADVIIQPVIIYASASLADVTAAIVAALAAADMAPTATSIWADPAALAALCALIGNITGAGTGDGTTHRDYSGTRLTIVKSGTGVTFTVGTTP